MRVLVTYGWCRTAYVICESLARAGFEVSACGPSALSMTRVSRHVKSFDRVPDPFASPRLYALAIGEICRRRRVRVVVPAHEDFVFLQEHRGLIPPETILAAPSLEKGLNALDKWDLIQHAAKAGIPVPATFAPGSTEEAGRIFSRIAFPAIVKPRRGNGGKGVALVRDADQGTTEYRRLVERFGLKAPALPLVQQHIRGTPVGSCFLAVDGELRACFVERYTRCKQAGFGTSVFREPAANPDIESYTSRLCRELKWTGVGHLDFIIDGSGTPYLLEMNPRFWGALHLAVRSGFDFPAALVSLMATGALGPRWFTTRRPVRSLWIAGELMACVEDARHGRWREILRSPARFLSSRCYDDFRLTDPLPLLMELAYYLVAFIRSGRSVNPVAAGMISPQSELACDANPT